MQFGMTHIIRICSDNPFIYAGDINALGDALTEYPNADYIGFKIGSTPSILTHYGFWAELVSLRALCAASESNDGIAREHVTSYIYRNEDKFDVKWLEPDCMSIGTGNGIRLTVDTHDDFMNAKAVYAVTGEDFSPSSVIELVKGIDGMRERMSLQMEINKK